MESKRIGDLDRLLRALIARSIRHRAAALVLALALVAAGLWCARRLPLDVTPDISSLQVQVLTPTAGLAPEEAETSITRPIELEMFGLPGLEQVRSLTRFGVSQIALTFSDHTDLYRARQLVTERLAQAQPKLPRGFAPTLAPPSTGLGEIFTYALICEPGTPAAAQPLEARLRQLRTLQEFVVKPVLRAVPGITEINTSGGYERQLVVTPDPAKLTLYGVDLDDIAGALERNTAVGGGALVDRKAGQVVLRSLARIQKPEDFEALTIKLTWGASSVALKDVAKVEIGSNIRFGAATFNGQEAVLGTALMLSGGNARETARRFGEALGKTQAQLPPGIRIRALYDRSTLVDSVISTVRTNLLTAAVLVAAILFTFLGNWRAALIVTSILILAFALGISGMAALGVAGSLLSLGAIDFGVVVDDTIVMVENVVRRLAGAPADGAAASKAARLRMVFEACLQVRRPMFVGMLVIIAAYLPIFGLSGVEGRMFRPMAAAILLVLCSSLVLTLLLVPAFCAAGLAAGASSAEPAFLKAMRAAYERLFEACRRRWILLACGVIALAAIGAWQATKLGADFMPHLDEGWTVVEMERPPGTSLPASLESELRCERALLAEVPEIETLFSRIGMSSIATDPQGANQNDLYIGFRPRSEWRKADGLTISKAELERTIEAIIRRVAPDQQLALNQPIAVRFDEILEGVRTDVAIKLYGSDFDQLDATAKRVSGIVKEIPGAGEVMIDQTGRCETLEYVVNREQANQYMVWADQIDNAVTTAVQGRVVGRIDDGEQFYPVAVRLLRQEEASNEALGAIPLRTAEGSVMLKLGMIGTWEKKPQVCAITHEGCLRREAIFINVEGGDAQGFMERARAALVRLRLPGGVRMEFGGSYQHLASGRLRLAVLGFAVWIASLLLVRAALRDWRQTGLVALGAPFATIGGIFGLSICGLPFTMPAAVGFVTLAGLSILNGMVLITCFNELRATGLSARMAALDSAKMRLRPVLMTALVAAAGFIPMALSRAPGAELQRPFAIVVIAGMVSASFLTLFLVPMLSERMDSRPD